MEPKPAVPDISFLHPLVGQEIAVVFGVLDMEPVALDLPLEPVSQVDGIIP